VPCQTFDPRDDYKAEADKVTRLLCMVLKGVSPHDIRSFPVDLQNWWTKHQEEDRRRLRYEAQKRVTQRAKRKALNKLTPEEKRLLGL